MKTLRFSIFFFVLIFLTGCATTYNPVTAKNEFIFIGTKSEINLGKAISRQIAIEKKLIQEGPQIERIKRIGAKVVHYSDRKDLTYNFFLIKDKEFNAFAVPGGFIYIHSGLADAATDDELACVIAHEIVHIAARHSVKKLQASLGYQLLITVGLGNDDLAMARDISDMIFNLSELGYSRQDETLADIVGVKYAYLSNFRPEAMISFFEKLKKESRERGAALPLEIFSSHPDIDSRIKTIEAEIKRLKSFGK